MKTWIIGNWKNNPISVTETTQLISDLKVSYDVINQAKTDSNNPSYQQAHMVMPSHLHLSVVNDLLADTDILLGGQDVGKEAATTGAYTGDVSAAQLADIGATWSLVGHSERREYYQETPEVLSKKIINAVSQGLGVVFCIGESLAEYEAQQTLSVLTEQLNLLQAVNNEVTLTADNFIVAYEPVWAIGTGKVPSVAEVEVAHQAIKESITAINPTLAETSILYGGSVNPDNAEAFAQSPWIQGALIGGASLNANKFIDIASIFYKIKSAK